MFPSFFRFGWRSAVSAVCSIFPFVLQPAAAFDQAVPVLPANAWEVSPDSQVKLSESDSCLVIDYTVTVKEPHQVGNYTYLTGLFDLLLKKPIPLSEKADRVMFESIGSELKTWNTREDQVRLRPLIRDASGEVHIYCANPFEPLKVSKKGEGDSARWRRWMTRQFYTSEAGGATTEIYESRGGDKNAWPDAPLTFIGFEVEVRKPKEGTYSGHLVLGSCNLLGGVIEREDPWIYADALCGGKSGNFNIGYEASNAFQGKPLIGQTSALLYDAQSLQSGKQRVAFKLGPDGNYWINYRLVDAEGKNVGSDFFRYDVYDRGKTPKLPGRDLSEPPPSGRLRINPETHLGGVYELNETFDVIARVYPQESRNLVLRWELMPAATPEVLKKGEQPLKPAGNSRFQDSKISVAGQKGRDAYRLRVQLLDDGKVLDETVYHLGRKTAFTEPKGEVVNPLCDREKIKQGSYNRVTLVPLSTIRFKSEEEKVKYFLNRLDQVRPITQNVTYDIDLRDLEPLPGVYDFNFTDRFLDAAAKRGMAVTLRLDHIDEQGEFTWIKFSRQHSYDGTEIHEHFYGGFCAGDKAYQNEWHDALHAIYRRYGDHPAFQGYYLLQPAGEFTVSDKPWEGVISGYEPPMRQAFHAYLQENAGLTLAALNKRWNTQFKTWDEVSVPLPDLKSGRQPDLRMQWVDFCCFKRWLDTQFWFAEAAAKIRSYDPHHVIIAYGFDLGAMKGFVDYAHNGGNHFPKWEGELVEPCEKNNMGWITEPHHPGRWAAYGDTAERGWVLDWSVWIMLAQAGGYGANLHVYYDATTLNLLSKYGGSFAYDRMQKFYPILNELHEMKLVSSRPEVAVLQDPYTLYCKHRTTFSQRSEDLGRWFELLKTDNVSYETLNPERISQYKLIVPNVIDEVVSLKSLEQFEDAVKNHGAKMLIGANTGSYCPELGPGRFALLRRLGIEPPEGEFVTQDRHVEADVTRDGPLFTKGSKVPFFTLADFQSDLQSKEIRDHFWTYPYRWIPQTDYFGYYRDNKKNNGEVLARFTSGAPAVSLHRVGKGEVVVFWGVPDYRPSRLGGMMARAASWAGISLPLSGNPIPLMREGSSKVLERHYAMLYKEEAGTYAQRLQMVPDGDWFVDDMVSGERLGTITGAKSRSEGIKVTFCPTQSPLKILRFIKTSAMQAKWLPAYPEAAASPSK